MVALKSAVLLSICSNVVLGGCPYLESRQLSSSPSEKTAHSPSATAAERSLYYTALAGIDWSSLQSDLEDLFVTSDPTWPHDYDSYAPLFVRLAWHCSGSYRASDGRGGCAGGRQRFEPERSWGELS